MIDDAFIDPQPTDVAAAYRAVGWAAESGFVSDPGELDELAREGRIVLAVTRRSHTDAPGVVQDVEGVAPLHGLVRADRQIANLTARLDDLERRQR